MKKKPFIEIDLQHIRYCDCTVLVSSYTGTGDYEEPWKEEF